jgi:2-oxoglutarate dehydrogenase E2 component (dihydrolipoamide succinyltransferase)
MAGTERRQRDGVTLPAASRQPPAAVRNEVTNIVVPELGESVVEARIARWLKKEGEAVALGEPLVELETEKIDLEVSADRAGVLTSIRHGEGADVKVGEVLAVLDPSATATATPAAPAAPAASAPSGAAGAAAPAAADASAPKATPAAKNVAKEHAVKLADVPAAGPRVTKQDVREFVAAASAAPSATAAAPAAAKAPAPPRPAPAPVAPGERTEERVRMTKRRATIARRLVEAQRTAAMLTTFNEVDMTAVMDVRARRKEAFQKAHGVNLGLTSFFVKAAVGALKAFPALNAEIQGDEIVYKRYYDIGMAVGAEGGLVVPVLRDADRMGFAGIELAVRDFAARAGDGTLTLEDLKGGTFTITNGGVFGSLMSTPILNPPQVGILGLHKIADRPVAVNGQVVVRPMMYLALSYDHRIVDGREAVQFLVKIKDFIEDPSWLLIDG